MSELTSCNYCSLRRMRLDASSRGVEVIVSVDEHGWIAARYSDRDEPSAWFMEVSNECAC